jgi:release factor glutamine methyltransferase
MISSVLEKSTNVLQPISDAPRLEAETLLAKILGVTTTYLHTWPEKYISSEHESQFQTFLTQRLNGQPLAYILGEQAFWDMVFYVNKHTLIPRPETENLVEIILEKFTQQPTLKILDLGTGCGAIALALAKTKPDWQIVATDISPEALSIAKENANRYQIKNVQFYLSDWFTALSKQEVEKDFDVIVSNPPYIAASDPFLEKNVFQTEPKHALISGSTGLEALQTIIAGAEKFLAKPGSLMVEHGFQQGSAVRHLFAKAGYSHIETRLDLSSQERTTFAKINYF